MAPSEERTQIDTGHGTVSGVWNWPTPTRAVVVVAHGAGVGMDAPVLTGFTECLNDAFVSTLRFNFPYMEAGRRTPDRAPVLTDAWRAAFELAQKRADGRRVFVAGKSLGGRMASLAVADGMPAAGLVFLGYPLHAPGKTDQLRDEHLYRIHVPMLFLQGTADPFARFDLIQSVADGLGRWAVLHLVEGGDHSFRVRGRRQPDQTIGRLLGSVAARFIQGAQI
jgi:uncharacterized protein